MAAYCAVDVTRPAAAVRCGCACQMRCHRLIPTAVKLGAVSAGGTTTAATVTSAVSLIVSGPTQMLLL